VGDLVSGTPPDIVVDFSALWAQVAAGDDVERWAPAAADGLWRWSGQPHSRSDVERLAAELAVLGEAAQRSGAYGAFFLCPELGRGPMAVVRLNGLTYPSGTSVHEVVDDFLFPEEMQLLPPDVLHVSGPGVPRVRVRQRAYTDDTRSISEYVSYVFPFDGAAWVLSVSFLDPRQADRWLEELDTLAAGVQLQGGAR
jgi:hypothetical protein